MHCDSPAAQLSQRLSKMTAALTGLRRAHLFQKVPVRSPAGLVPAAHLLLWNEIYEALDIPAARSWQELYARQKVQI